MDFLKKRILIRYVDHVWRTHPYDPVLLEKANAKL
jgi:hypothetical protein